MDITNQTLQPSSVNNADNPQTGTISTETQTNGTDVSQHIENLPQTVVVDSQQPAKHGKFPKIKIPSISKKALIIFAIIMFLVLVVLLLFSAFGKRVRNTILPEVTPSPTPSASVPELFNPSPYADDSEIRSLSERLVNFDKELGTVVLREDTIRPPVLNWDVNFKK